MPTFREEVKRLVGQTAVGSPTENRVFYLVLDSTDPNILARLIGNLFKTLEEKKILDPADIDALLADSISPETSELLRGKTLEQYLEDYPEAAPGNNPVEAQR